MMSGTTKRGKRSSGRQDNVVRFRGVKKTTLPDQIIDQIHAMIISGELKPGDRLPSERELCESLNVGRSSVRETLKTLETLGMIKRHTTGTTVSPPAENSFSALSFAASGASLKDLLEMTGIITVGTVALAAERATQEQIERMEKTLHRVEDLRQAVFVHFSFHRAVVEAAQNPILSQLVNVITSWISLSPETLSALGAMNEEEWRRFLKTASEGYGKILQAIRAHDASAARECMKEHDEHLRNTMLEKLEEASAKGGRARRAP